jgi:hypothetical protein
MGKKKNKLDEFHYHEIADRAYLLVHTIEDYLLGHPVVEKHKEIKKRVEKASTLLAEISQIAGGLEYNLFPESNDNTDNSDVNKEKEV